MPSEALLADLQSRLQAERDQLRNQLSELGYADGGTGLEYDENFADSSQVTAERGEAEALARTLSETLAEVESALEQMEAGTFGICTNCGNPISEARLEAMPAAKLCIDCASKR